jgi:hypothetical protein
MAKGQQGPTSKWKRVCPRGREACKREEETNLLTGRIRRKAWVLLERASLRRLASKLCVGIRLKLSTCSLRHVKVLSVLLSAEPGSFIRSVLPCFSALNIDMGLKVNLEL